MSKSSRFPPNAPRRPSDSSASNEGGRPGSGRPSFQKDRGGNRPWSKPKASPGGEPPKDGSVWLYGTHAVLAALANPKRKILELKATRNTIGDLPESTNPVLIEGEVLSGLLPSGAVHQGLAVRVVPLEPVDLDVALPRADGLAIVLDQVTDPQNVGAIFRSAAAFGARAVIQQDRKAPPVTGALAKAAVGAVETVADVRVVNVSMTVQELSQEGWRTVGLSGEATQDLADVLDGSPTLLVMGAEGKGLRPLVAERCDVLARIPMDPKMESLNVSAASAIALYAAFMAQKGKAND
jgi:23S rRNA (guanosine2251-2'-O)-methyltransferase